MRRRAGSVRHSLWLFAIVAAAAPASAQTGVTLPVGVNLRDRPEQPGDVSLEISRAGVYSLNGQPIAAGQLAGQLATLMSGTRDHVLYVRADAHLVSSAIDSAVAIAARGNVCVASFVGTRQPYTASFVPGDHVNGRAEVARQAIDVQLPLIGAPLAVITRVQASAIVLEVFPGPAYRINGQAVPADSLKQRLLEILEPRPMKVLYLRADPALPFQDVFHAMDAARHAVVKDIVAAPPELTIGTTLPSIDLSMPVTQRDDSAAERIEGNVGRCRRGDVYLAKLVPVKGAVVDVNQVYFEFQVETQAKLLADSYVLHYPELLRTAGVTGQVKAQFVVDTNGHALPETCKVLAETHALFTQSVKAALPDMRFVSATIGGKPVRQLVQQRFPFTITP
jgi:biopolymer transport protein ExbD